MNCVTGCAAKTVGGTGCAAANGWWYYVSSECYGVGYDSDGVCGIDYAVGY